MTETAAPESFSITGESGESYHVAGEAVSTTYGRSWLHRCRDAEGRDRLFQQYTLPIDDPRVLEWSRRAVDSGREIVLSDRRRGRRAGSAAALINWPIDRVLRDGVLVGVVLPAVPGEFLHPDGTLRTVDRLYSEKDTPAPEFRISVLIRFCEIFEVLEQRGLVHGDVARQNLLWSQTWPGAYLLGADALRPIDAPPAARPVPAEWRDPRTVFGEVAGHDRFSDRLGLAMLLYRGLFLRADLPAVVDGQWRKPADLPFALDPWLRSMFERAFGDPTETEDRPTAGEWRTALVAAFRTADGGFRTDALISVGGQPPRAEKSARTNDAPRDSGSSGQQTKAANSSPGGHARTVPGSNSNTAAFATGSAPSQDAPLRNFIVVLIVAAMVILGIAVAVHAADSNDDKNNPYATRTSTTYPTSAYTTSPYTTRAYTPGSSPTTRYTYSSPSPSAPPLGWSSLDAASTDTTPFTASALLPQGFRDDKNVNYTLRSAGVKDCITTDQSSNVKSALRQHNCSQQIAGTYVDESDHILVSVSVMAFSSESEAIGLFDSVKDMEGDWSMWCPSSGAGADVCNSRYRSALRSGWGVQHYRYLIETTSLYINLSSSSVVKEWLDPAARSAARQAGPENYWHK